MTPAFEENRECCKFVSERKPRNREEKRLFVVFSDGSFHTPLGHKYDSIAAEKKFSPSHSSSERKSYHCHHSYQ